MKVYEDFRKVPRDDGPTVVTIGSFDGFHLGHQLLLSRVREWAGRHGWRSALLTFQPHPARALAPGLSPPLLMTPTRKRRALLALDLELLLLQRFEPRFAELSPRAFAGEVLSKHLMVRGVVVGDDFTFGKTRSGRVEDLVGFGKELGFEVEVVRRLAVKGITVSSTLVRSFVLQGKVRGAALLLGRPYLIEGVVVAGIGRGRTLGFPTANLNSDAELLPALGVYVCQVWVEGETEARPAVTNVGVNPTFCPGEVRVEAHLLSEPGNLLGRRLAIAFLERLRPEQAFSSAELLTDQIRRDVAEAQAYFSSWKGSTAIDPLDGIPIILDRLVPA